MNEYLFADFLQSREAYEQCRRYWSTLVDSIAMSLGQSGEWKPWMPEFYGDGKTPIETDLRPIFDAHSSRLERAFQISQHPPDRRTDAHGIGVWLNSDEDPDDLPRYRLGISVVLDQDSARTVEEILRSWMNPTTTLDAMDTLIRTRKRARSR